MKTDVYIGFDSAWTDNLKAPGAICAASVQDGRIVSWHHPRLASFREAQDFITTHRSKDGLTLIALDQPTLVPNSNSMRPVERAVASVISWLGGGVQPSHTGKIGMFCKDSPVWPFLKAVDAVQDPERARNAMEGTYLIEVFPALALPSLDASFETRLGAPKYNPGNRKKFTLADWIRVTAAVAKEADELNCTELANWCLGAGKIDKPTKADQDRLDAGICLAIALRWRLRPQETSLMIGDLQTGYMVTPASATMRERLTVATAKKGGVPLDGVGS